MNNVDRVWYVTGENDRSDRYFPTFFNTKEAAEIYARVLFPDEDVSRRHERVYSRDVLTMADLNGG
jgi:hypothetical protein